MKKKANNRATFESFIRTAVTMNFLVDSLVQVTSEKSPPIRARAAVFQKCGDHWIKMRKEAKWGIV